MAADVHKITAQVLMMLNSSGSMDSSLIDAARGYAREAQVDVPASAIVGLGLLIWGRERA